MVKKQVTITLDEELHDEARLLMNISAVAEDAIKKKMNIKEIVVKEKCEFCGRDEPKAYVDHSTGKYHDGLTWLCPDERWICTGCIKYKQTH